MFIKKVGYLLLIKLKIFHFAAKLSILGLIFSFVVPYFLINLRQTYRFQQPSINTKIFDVLSPKNSYRRYQYCTYTWSSIELMHSYHISLEYFIFDKDIKDEKQWRIIYQTLITQNHNPKNIAFLSYKNVSLLQSFFNWYYDPHQNCKFSMGTIRVGLNIDFTLNPKETLQQADKTFYKIYTKSTHPDLDYYHVIKDLLKKMNVPSSPCEAIHRNIVFKSTKRLLVKVEQMITGRTQMKGFYDQVLCQLYEHFHKEKSAHEIMMNNGFQSATIRYELVQPQNQKLQKLIISFINQFSVQQDHLHSAQTIYYPISDTYFAPLLLFFSASIIFMISLAVYLIKEYTYHSHSIDFEVSSIYPIIIFVMINQYYLFQNYNIALAAGFIQSIFTFIKDLANIRKKEDQSTHLNPIEIIMIAVQGLLALYFGIFNLGLSYITMFLTIIMLLKSKNRYMRVVWKLTLLLLFYGFLFYFQKLNFSVIITDLMQISPHLQLILIIPFFFYSI